MRIKTLLLAAVLSAAGAATSLAQVYSVNAVGYVNLVIPPGLSMIANPLNAPSNVIGSVLNVPAGTQVYKFTGTGFDIATLDDIDGWVGSGGVPKADMSLAPGEGVFIRNNGATAFTNTFVGEVVQGATVTVALPNGLSIVSSKVPQSGGLSSVLSFPQVAGNQVYLFTGTGYNTFTFDDIDGWVRNGVPEEPQARVAEAFWARSIGNTNWIRNFTVTP